VDKEIEEYPFGVYSFWYIEVCRASTLTCGHIIIHLYGGVVEVSFSLVVKCIGYNYYFNNNIII